MIAVYLFRNPRILLLAILVVIVSGLSAFFVLPQLEDPVLGKRVGIVSTAFPGASAERVEALVTIPLEQQLYGIANIQQIRSNSLRGVSNLVVELEDEVKDVDPIWSKVRKHVADAQALLPSGCLPTELEVIPLKAFAAIIAVQSPQSDATDDEEVINSRLRKVSLELRSEILGIAGTESVSVFGDPGEEFLVELKPSTLAELGTSVGAVAKQVQDEIQPQPWGEVQESSLILPIEEGPSPPIRQLERIQIRSGPRGETAMLADVANIVRQMQPRDTEAIIDGRRGIVLGVLVDKEFRVDQWGDQLQRKLNAFQERYRATIGVEVLFAQQEHVQKRMATLFNNLGFSTLAVMLVVLVLMGWRSTLIVGMAVPLSALMVLSAMRWLGIPIHQMSVTGLIVALGLLIDNAIVVVDEVRSSIWHGTPPAEAIRKSLGLLTVPLFGSTLTTVFAFLPIATLPGPPGEFVGSIAVTVILAIGSSLLLSLTVVPALLSLIPVDSSRRGIMDYGLSSEFLAKTYRSTLGVVFEYPMMGVCLGLILPISGFILAQHLPEQFFPPSDRSQIQIELEHSAETSLTATRDTVESVRKLVEAHENVERQSWFLGGSAPTFFYNVVPRRRGTPFYAQAFVDLTDAASSAATVRSLQHQLAAVHPECRIIVRQLEQGPPFDAPIELRIAGPDLGVLRQLGAELRKLLSETPHVIQTRSDLEETLPRVQLEIDDVALRAEGFDRTQLSRQIYTSLHGAPAGGLMDGDEELPVRVQLSFDDGQQLEQIAALPLQSFAPTPPSFVLGMPPPPAKWKPVSLNHLAELKLDSDVGAIIRIDGTRVNEVKAYLNAGILPSIVMREFQDKLANSEFTLPPGYSLTFGGETEQRTHAVNELIANAIVLFSLMLLTLVASFSSFRCAGIIAGVGSLSMGLGPLALWLFGFPFGFMAIVGTMGLIGVAINDSIVVLAAIQSDAKIQQGDRTQLVHVVNHCTRHVIATTLTTIVGFLPLILGGGSFWPPLAISIAGGVSGATLLALYFVPSVYLLVFHRQKR